MTRSRTATALVALATTVVAGAMVGCGGASAPGSSGKPLVVVTTTQLADFATILGGDDFEVYGLLRPNVDAHDHDPSPADLDAIARSEVIATNGLGLDTWVTDAIDASGTPVEPTVATDGVTLLASDPADRADTDHDEEGHDDEGHDDEQHSTDDGHDHDHDGEWNPHVWFDPTNARVMVDNLADALVAAAPSAADDIRSRQAAYIDRLTELDGWIAEQIDTLEDPLLVTDHDAFAYYIDRYGLGFVGTVIPSFDSAAEVSAADLDRLADAVSASDTPAVFTERSLPADAIEALARRAGVEVVSGPDGLYGDSLGPAGSSGGTYLEMMRHNTTSIVTHLS